MSNFILFVIPAEAGIQVSKGFPGVGFRRHDDNGTWSELPQQCLPIQEFGIGV